MLRSDVRTAFVTGGYGFIGSRVVQLLCDRGYEVTCLVRPKSVPLRISRLPIRIFSGDLFEGDALEEGLRGHDVCVHMASPSAWPQVLDGSVREVIVRGTKTVLDAARAAGCHRFVYVSSAAAVNGSREPQVFDEASPFELDGSGLDYAVAKHEAEGVVLGATGVESIVVNPVETYGPEDSGWVTAGNIRSILAERPVVVVRGGTSIAHVDDVATGIVGALEHGRPGERYILGGDNVSLADMAQMVLRHARMKAKVRVLPASLLKAGLTGMEKLRVRTPIPPRLIDYARLFWYVDSSKAASELGFTARGAHDTLAPTVDWVLGQIA